MKKKLSLKERRQRARFIKLSLLGVCGLLVFVGVFVGIQQGAVRVSSIAVEGESLTREDLIVNVAKQELEGRFALLIPRNSIFFANLGGIKQEILQSFHPVKSVSIRRTSFNTLTIEVTEREAVALWCSALDDEAPCFLLDDDGYVFLKNPTPTASLIRYAGGSVSKPLGDVFLGGAFSTFREFIEHVQTATQRTVVSALVDGHGDVRVSFAEGGELRFTEKNANSLLLDNIASVFASRRFETEEVFEYADFRFGNKIYVKFVGE